VAGSPELAARLGDRGRQAVEERFDVSRITDRYLAVLEELP
jgi:glycosyltransferase involved in cell wall biosynthesis